MDEPLLFRQSQYCGTYFSVYPNYALGFTINLLTLLAMVLAIGLVVDDAIVVLENIYRIEWAAATISGF